MNAALVARSWLVIPLLLVLVPHGPSLPAWLLLAWLACAGLSLLGAHQGRPWPGKALKWLITLAGLAGVALDYGTLIGPAGGVALLVFLSGAKLLEIEGQRDRLGLLFVGVFLLVAHFLASQSLTTAAYMALAALALAAALIASQTPGADLARKPFRPLAPAASLLGQALLFALPLFLLFPRIQGPLWGLPQQQMARSGLSDRMAPGDISQLIQSDELAFRAEFAEGEGGEPDSRTLYWRGPVLWDYDGRVWQTTLPVPGHPRGEPRGAPRHYTLTLEPHHQRWLFLLGLPDKLPDLPSHLGPDLQWTALHAVDQRLRYETGAYLDYRLDPDLAPEWRRRALTLPAEGNPRARALALGWRQTSITADEIVGKALELFRQSPFAYTLTPPPAGAEPVDDFLFSSKRGFCEHYAGAFVFLMRSAGVPARVVTGYQGGEYSALGRYWIVRGRDAHAWAEAWLPGRGWVRVDPTAAVAPDRVERGIGAALPAAELPGPMAVMNGAWLRPLLLGWDLVNNQWNQWVLGYNLERQRKLLSRLNPLLATLEGSLTILALACAGVLGLLGLGLFARRPPRRDPATRAYARFCGRLARAGLGRGAAEGPADFARRAGGARPDLASEIGRITGLYLAARYGKAEVGELAALKTAVARFRPGRRSR